MSRPDSQTMNQPDNERVALSVLYECLKTYSGSKMPRSDIGVGTLSPEASSVYLAVESALVNGHG